MTGPVPTSIARIPADVAGETGPAVVLAAAAEADIAAVYRRRGGATLSCRAGEPMVAIVSTGVLNSPDLLTATGGRRDGHDFTLHLEIRRFEGPIRANDPWIGLARVELGALDQGAYRLTVRRIVSWFADPARPATTTGATTTEQIVGFDCA